MRSRARWESDDHRPHHRLRPLSRRAVQSERTARAHGREAAAARVRRRAARRPHFETSYAAVDRDLPKLLAQHKPDIVLMFGLAGRTPHVRVETPARNARSILFPDVTGYRPDDAHDRPRQARPARPRPFRPPARCLERAAACARACRAMPAATCATTSIGARWRRPDPERRSPSSSTFRGFRSCARRPGRKRRMTHCGARARRRGDAARAASQRSAV